MATYSNYVVNSGWVTTPSYATNKGANSWAWMAKVTFTVTGPEPVVFIVTDRIQVSELVAIFDATGTTVSALSALQVCTDSQPSRNEIRQAKLCEFRRPMIGPPALRAAGVVPAGRLLALQLHGQLVLAGLWHANCCC